MEKVCDKKTFMKSAIIHNVCIRMIYKFILLFSLILACLGSIPLIFFCSVLLFINNKYKQLVNTIITFYLYRIIGWFFEQLFFQSVVIYYDNHKSIPCGRTLIIANHITNCDPILINYIFEKSIKIKYFYKYELEYIPIFGRLFKLSGFLPLKRSFFEDKQTIELFCKESNTNYLCIFPEGKRCTTQEKSISIEWCKTHNITPFIHVLCPRYKGYELIFNHISFTYLVDITIHYLDIPLTLFDICVTPKISHVIIRLNIKKVDSSMKSKNYLYEIFREKDTFIQTVIQNQS